MKWKGPGWVSAVDLLFGRFLQHQIDQGIEELVIELPGVPGSRHFDVWASGFVLHMFVRAISIAEVNGVPWAYCPTSTLKKFAVGKGNAKARELVGWARDVGYQCRSEHQGVAIALLEAARAGVVLTQRVD